MSCEVAVEPGKQAMPNRRLKPDSPRFIRKLFIILWERAFFISYGHPPIGNHAWFMAGSIGTLNPSESPPPFRAWESPCHRNWKRPALTMILIYAADCRDTNVPAMGQDGKSSRVME